MSDREIKYHENYAPDLVEAHQRWLDHREHDPFQDIPRALLSSEHIKAYVRQTGMIFPFDDGKSHLKAASYEIKPGKNFIFWDENGKKHTLDVKEQGTVTLPANSISFIKTEVQFKLPQYIALRFNLRITHVHRGLLLGTGPLIDPGFNGNLLIPLHNLTSEKYTIRADDGLIWVEFTKTSAKVDTVDVGPPKDAFVPTDPKKNDQPPDYFFDLANKNRPIQSSLPLVVAQANKLAGDAQKSASRAERTNRIFVGGGLLAIAGTVVTILSYFSAVNANVQASNSLAATVNTNALQAASTANSAADDIKTLKAELAAMSKIFETRNTEEQDLNTRLGTVTQDIAALRAQLAAPANPPPSAPAEVIRPSRPQGINPGAVGARRHRRSIKQRAHRIPAR